ncbi:MAG: arginase family protein [Candidatus Aminicenantaceae bacterium]
MTKSLRILLPCILLLFPVLSYDQEYREGEKVKVAVARNPFGASESILEEGLLGKLESLGCEIVKNESFSLTREEEAYRGWARSALISRHLADLISSNRKNENLVIGLLGSCADLPGILGGLQHMGPGQEEEVYHLAAYVPHRIALVYFDAHADINTPETTLSGMYGGMDVSLAAGLFNPNNRIAAGLDPPLPPSYILLADVRDTDPREMELIDRLNIEILSTDDIRHLTPNVRTQMDRLSVLADLIYIHVDMDVLAPEEVRGHNLTAPNGPTSQELAACIELMFTYPKTAAIGIASTPYGSRDPKHISRRAAVRLIEGAVSGVKKRTAHK